MSEVKSFWCHEASNVLCVRASDFDNLTRLFLDAAERAVASERREKELQQRLTEADEREDQRAALTNDDLVAIARNAALNSVDRYNYMPCLPEEAFAWKPHYWVIEAMRAALKPADGSKPSTCTWSEGGFSWHTGCGKEWQFTDGGLPSENGMHFCHSCGKTLVVESADPS
ncbi:hypothetical protein [Pseudomonas poae]|uniref:Zinc ribbon domain-containing protein n=1 Tax=Pseudomonas poae TaxID=200451 RepID=A0ABY0RC38_9PSED|nr:hypothetical protein [Pseudomonas poae]SDN52221.1 hypothetical protein SAMN04490208_0577 [Pseudomonas poae]